MFNPSNSLLTSLPLTLTAIAISAILSACNQNTESTQAKAPTKTMADTSKTDAKNDAKSTNEKIGEKTSDKTNDSKDGKDNKGNKEGNKEGKIGDKSADKKSDPVSVTLVTAEAKALPVVIKATGTVVSLNSVDVRSQASSVVKQVHIKEGQFVHRGDLLFTLDARLDEATLAKAQAQLNKDQAALQDLVRQAARQEQLLAQNFISRSSLDTAKASVDTQTALVSADQAAIAAARVPVSYAKIVAPSSGRVGAIAVFAGSFVQAGSTPLLSITQLAPIAVSFNVPQAQLPKVLQVLHKQLTLTVQAP